MNPFKPIGRYFKRILLAIDQLGNTLIGGAADETISARAGRNPSNPAADVLCDILDVLDKDHCKEAVEAEALGKHQADAYKTEPDGTIVVVVRAD